MPHARLTRPVDGVGAVASTSGDPPAPGKTKRVSVRVRGATTATKKTRKPKAPKKPRAPKPAAKPGAFHEATGASASLGRSAPTALGPAAHAAGSGQPALNLADLGGSISGSGLGDVLLDLVGEGQLRLGHALHAWQREQERVANRAWRRPGGMARMGGL